MLFNNSQPRYFPHLQQPKLINMGLEKLDPKYWIEPDETLNEFYQHKLHQREQLGTKVYRHLPESLEAQKELHSLLKNHLINDHSNLYHNSDQGLTSDFYQLDWPDNPQEPLWNTSLWVADDLVIMQPSEQGYRITAASLSSPSHWLLEEKFGLALQQIHQPIPDLNAELGSSIDRFFNHIKADYPACRFNWGVETRLQLSERLETSDAVEPGTPLYYRVERQTLRRLPKTHAVAFTIRVYQHPLEQLRQHPGVLPALLTAIDAMPNAHASYKDFQLLQPALTAYR